MTRILFLDLDGTLLNDEKQVTDRNRQALLKAVEAGHKIVITTGRALSCAIELARSLELTMEGCYVIAYNGGCIYDMYHERDVFRNTIPMEYVRYLLDEAKKSKIHAHSYSDTEVVSEQENEDLYQYVKNTQMTYRIVDSVTDALKENPCKVLIVNYREHQPLEEYRKKIASWAEGKVDYCFSCEQLLEIVPLGVSKGTAIRILCEKLEIPMENTISVGDAENDICMLQTTQISVVMKNAAPHMYMYADYITEHDNNHDGIAEVIEKVILI